MQTEVDYYALLEVDRGCDDGQLKSAYRRAAMRWHPDRNPGDGAAEQRFKLVNEAYSVLSDPHKRAAYDRFGHAAFRNGAGGPHGHPFGHGSPFEDIFSDIFDQFMGGAAGAQRAGRRAGPQRGADVRHDIEVTLEEAFHGAERELGLDVAVPCDHCLGSGSKPGARVETCGTCHGRGQVRMQNGMFIVERVCPACHGSGQRISDPCEHCHGEGRVERRKTLKIRIPPGVDDGTRIRLSGEGEAGPRGGGPGDLYVFVHMARHPLFQRDGTTLLAAVPISFVDAALGSDISFPGIDREPVTVKVPPGTQSGRQFRVRGRGMPALNGHGRGDLVVQLECETPTRLSARQRELLEEFRSGEREGQGEGSCPRSRSFLDRLKNAWDELTE